MPNFPHFFAYLVDDFSPFLGPHWGNIGIRYYGLGYLLGFLTAAWLLRLYARAGRSQLPESKIGDLMIGLVLGVLLGGRLGYFILYYPFASLRADPFVLFRVWEGGMASHGGFAGVTVAAWWFARTEKIPFLHLGDLVASTTSAGMLFVRVANFINGELWGKITTVPWAVIFPRSAPPGTPLAQIPPRHPSQLYEAGLEGALLLAYMQWRFWRSDAVKRQPGRLCGEFLIGYALVRMFGEIFREPDAGLILGLSRGTFYSIFLVAAGAALVVHGFVRRTSSP
jgi:phosphatidylglycerol:prolipoprotein diacylglycerol transferase